ncbi:mercury resistance system periplasmic binding protein MerP [Marinagarivorans cellulosilyticus]|uniref:Periplasmic mercury ion-binding protein n=1 Tax=Marinagarivorans cellulosilyticus TaxID=2721545 RepID=A0AAN1WJD7_9GAMM|nr:mercury resistance system periplasmic binding protein MerP [Marinagarivorans cellulosilyticus]BCD98683.1 periplasmic mercuric ion binding protein [Marinagarivorans cellulosilyticus]
MKKLTVFLLSVFSISGAFAEEQLVELSLPSMNCAVCPITIKKALEKVEGVHFVEVTYKTKLATVKFENTVTSIDDLISVTTNAGFPSTLKSEASND